MKTKMSKSLVFCGIFFLCSMIQMVLPTTKVSARSSYGNLYVHVKQGISDARNALVIAEGSSELYALTPLGWAYYARVKAGNYDLYVNGRRGGQVYVPSGRYIHVTIQNGSVSSYYPILDIDLASVSPSGSLLGQDLNVTLTGIGLDESTEVSMYLDPENIIKIESEIVKNGDGSISLTLPGQSTAGKYTLRVSNGSETDDLHNAVTFSYPKAIIVAGGGPYPENHLWETTRMCADHAYKVLLHQGYTKDRIYYLNPEIDTDIDGDGASDVDGNCTYNNLDYAINTWVDSGDPALELLIYMTDHGFPGVFQLNRQEYLRAEDLDLWLDALQETMPGNLILVYDACHSGSFVPLLRPPLGKNRIIITSAKDNENAYFITRGKLSFSFQLWAGINQSAELYRSFVDAKEIMGGYQTSIIDADGNGIGNELYDQELADGIIIGKGLQSAPIPPFLHLKKKILGDTFSTFQVETLFPDNVERVWATITPPDHHPESSDIPVTELPEMEFRHVGEGVYEGTYKDFTQSGLYEFGIYASNTEGVFSRPIHRTVRNTGGRNMTGYMVTPDLWIGSVINTEDKGTIEAVWKEGGKDTTFRGDEVLWGHFHANPDDVPWGSENNPDIFVKIWFDISGRVDVNFFHVSVPDIEVYSEFGGKSEHGMTTLSARYIRHYYESGQSGSEEKIEDGNPLAGDLPTGNPAGHPVIDDLKIGAIIKTVEKGPVNGVWRLGGQDVTSRGDKVLWGHFYANPFDVAWGSMDNPDLFVKIWFDAGGRTDVNFFHVSVPDIEVFSDLPSDGEYDQRGTTILENRYVRQMYGQ